MEYKYKIHNNLRSSTHSVSFDFYGRTKPTPLLLTTTEPGRVSCGATTPSSVLWFAATSAKSFWGCCRRWAEMERLAQQLQRWDSWCLWGTGSGPFACCRTACGRQCGRSPRRVCGSCPAAGGLWRCASAGWPPARSPRASAWSEPAARPSFGWDRPPSSGRRSARAAWRSSCWWGLVTAGGSAAVEESNQLKEWRKQSHLRQSDNLHLLCTKLKENVQ